MNNPYLTVEEIRDTFINTKLEENYNFLEEDLEKLASAFVMADDLYVLERLVMYTMNSCMGEVG